MKIEQTVHISRPVDEIWAFLSDVPVVVGCIPGAELGEKLDDDRYRGSFRLKVGPLTAKIDGEGQVTRDNAARIGRITGRGNDKRGGSRVSASVLYNVKSDTGGSVLGVNADFELSGPLAQIGRTGLIEDVARRLTEEFTASLERKLQEAFPNSAGTEPESVTLSVNQNQFDAGAAVTSVILRRVAAFFTRLFGKRA